MAALTQDEVFERLDFAHRRITDVLSLNSGDLLGADPHERQMLVQEVFFHLGGAIEVFAQLVNDQRGLGKASEEVSISKIAGWLTPGDPLIAAVNDLYVNPRGQTLPANPYTDYWLMLRIWNYRHQVTHRRRNPFQMSIELNARVRISDHEPRSEQFARWMNRGDPPTHRSAHFILDPRSLPGDASLATVEAELAAMYELVDARLHTAIRAL